MSVYSRSVADGARVIFPFDSTYISNQGTIVASTLPIAYGSNPTFNSQSPSGGDGSWIRSSAGYLQNSAINVIEPYSGEFAIEFVFKTTATGGTLGGISGSVSVNINSGGGLDFNTSNGSYSKQVNSSIAINDGLWHHVVVRRNDGNYHSIWIDGTKNQDESAFFGSFNNDSGFYAGNFVGTMDFAAEYQTLSDTQITQHASDFVAARTILNNFAYLTPVMTATGLAVQPAITTIKAPNIAAAPATASAASGDHYNSTRDNFTLLDTYMSGLALEQYYKFDEPTVMTNYGTGGSPGYLYGGTAKNDVTSGIQGEGALRITGSQNTSVVTAVSTVAINSEITDGDFSLGFWVKKSTAQEALIYQAYVNGVGGLSTNFNSSGYIYADAYLSNQNHTITSSTNYADGNWHYVAVRMSGTTMQLWVDNVSIGTVTVNHSFSSIDKSTFSGGSGSNTELMYVSQFYIAPSSVVTSTEIANIWTYGQPVVQGGAAMPMPKFSRDNALNQYIASKSPIFYFKMDEATGLPLNYGSVDTTSTVVGSNYTQNVSSPNYKAYSFTNRDTEITGSWSATAGTFSTNNRQTILFYAKYGSGVAQSFGAAASNGDVGGAGLILQPNANNTVRLRTNDAVTSDTATTTATFNDGNYHMYVGVRDGANMTLYVDGVQRATMSSAAINLTDYGQFTIGGAPLFVTTAARTLFVDEFAVFDTAFSAADALDAYQKIALVQDTTANALMVHPSLTLGTGRTINPGVAYATALLPDPTQTDEIRMLPTPMTAFAEPRHPNYVATVFIESYYNASPMTSSALFHMPQYNIGESNASDTMNASALMPNALFSTPGYLQVNPGIATDALLVMPGLITIKGARVFAEILTARAFAPLPPAYVQLTDDPWYVRLLAEHADRKKEPVQTYLSSLPNQTVTDIISGGFLAFFSKVTTDITPTTTINAIDGSIPKYFFKPEGYYAYETTGELIAVDGSYNAARAIATRNALTPTPILSKGYYDDQQRKAVRIENIEFPFEGTSENHSQRSYSIEFSIKTTKSNQVLTYGKWSSFYYNQRSIGTIGLYNGKLYLMDSFQGIGKADVIPHPSNLDQIWKQQLSPHYMLGNKSIDDGNWHHVVIQYGYDDYRSQIWIDGKLDKQLGVLSDRGGTSYGNEPGFDGTNKIRPYILGFNSKDSKLYSDFLTSAWNFYPGRFLESGAVTLNYEAYGKWTPIPAEPMLASIKLSDDNSASGNRKRALLLYWFEDEQVGTQFRQTYTDTFDNTLITKDLKTDPPQQYNGWDIFPVSVLGTQSSEVVKSGVWLTGGYYRNKVTGAPRYLDVVNDLDLDKFDSIFFLNYPVTSSQLDRLVRDEYSDTYFKIKEKDLYDDFLKSLRAAVDTGISLYITNYQLALDMGIIDRVETIPVFNDIVLNDTDFSDFRAPILTGRTKYVQETDKFVYDSWEDSTLPLAPDMPAAAWQDSFNNMKHRVVNTIEYLTDDSSYIYKDRALYLNDDRFDYGGPDKSYHKFEYRLNGLQPGDEFLFGDIYPTTFGMTREQQYSLNVVPFENVKAGKIVTAQPLQYYKKNTLVDNPYANYAHSIAIEPNDMLNGKPVGGKIFVNFTETFWDRTNEYFTVDLVTDYWINIAYDLGLLDDAQRNKLKDITTPEGKQYRGNVPPGAQKDVYEYWSSSGDFIFMQFDSGDQYSGVLGLLFDGDTKVDKVSSTRGFLPSATRARDKLGRFASGTGGGGLPFAKLSYGRSAPTLNVYVPNLITRGFWWLSERNRQTGLVLRSAAMTAILTMPLAKAVPDKPVSIPVTSMICNATIVDVRESVRSSINTVTLPLTATAIMVTLGTNVTHSVYIMQAMFPEPGVFTFGAEPVILYLENTEPVLYIRGDKIK